MLSIDENNRRILLLKGADFFQFKKNREISSRSILILRSRKILFFVQRVIV